MGILSSPAALNSQRHLESCLQYHPKTLSIQTKFQRHSKKATPPLIKRHNAAKRTSSTCRKDWRKPRPLAHCLEQSSQAKLESNIAMCFTIFTWQNAQAKTPNSRSLLYRRKLSFKWNRKKSSSSLNTKTKNLKPHVQLIDSNYRLEIMSLTR